LATIFAHPLVPLAMRAGFGVEVVSGKLLFWAALASILPDIDVIAFSYDISYASEFGHRGFTHSIFFAVLAGFLGLVFFRYLQTTRVIAFTILSISTISHGLLDAMTDGGLGIAFFWPISVERYFLPWQPLEVSPIGVGGFFNERGAAVLYSEFVWIVLPLVLLTTVIFAFRKVRRARRKKHAPE